MALLFDRRVSFSFGQRGESSLSFTGLRVKFKIEKTSEPAPNKAEISIFNMSKDSRARAERTGNILLLEAGYEQTLEGIFTGDATRALTRQEGADVITTFESGDGNEAYQKAKVNLSFAPGSNIKDVVSRLASALGVTIGEVSGVKSQTLQNGFVASGPVRNSLSNLIEKQGLEWSIQDGALQIIPKGGTTQQEVVRLSSDTGLIGSPQKKDSGLEITCLLQPKLKPGRALFLESKFVKGVFRCVKVTHVGDSEGKEWFTMVEVV